MSSDQQKRSESEEPTIAPEEQSAEAPTIPPSDEQKPSEAGTASPLPGTKVRYFGDYELLEEIARGGMGVVYKARQISLNRIVAMKMILAGQLAGQEEVERFHVEAEAAAKLDHPGIVPIFEVGEHEGQHYFSMGFVDGHSLADKLNDGPLPSSEAAELARHLAEAVAYAHEQGVIHRDLKPANVLLDKNDQPRITDFGLAKKMEADSNLTGTGQILGTPSYMPPEQAAGKTQDVGPAADVYSLGAVLYAMLTGRPPFQAASPMDTLMQVLEQQPVAPRRLDTKVPQDVETISLKCLEKESSRRYASARDLVDELQRFLNGQPIQARPLNAPTRLWRWCRRKPALAALTATLILAVVVGFVGITTQWIRAEKESLRAETNAQQKTQLAAQKTALAQQKTDLAQKERDARQGAERLMRISQAQGLAVQAEVARNESPVRSLLLSIEAVQATRRHNEPTLPISLRALKTGLAAVGGRPLTRHKGQNGVVMSQDGRRLAAAHEDGTLQVWELTANDPLATRLVWQAGEAGVGRLPLMSRDGRWLVLSSAGRPIQIWDLDASDPRASRRALWQEEGAAWTARQISPNNRWLVASGHLPWRQANRSGFEPLGLCVWNLEKDDPVAAANVLLPISPQLKYLVYSNEPPFHDFLSPAISGDSRWLVSTGCDGTRLWDLTAKDIAASVVFRGGHAVPMGVVGTVSPDGHWLVTIGVGDPTIRSHRNAEDATIETLHRLMAERMQDSVEAGLRLWDLTTEDAMDSPHELRTAGPVERMAVSPDGRWLVAGGNQTPQGLGLSWLQLWDLTASDPSATPFNLPCQLVTRVAMSPNSRWLVTVHGATVRRWDLTASDPASTAVPLKHEDSVTCLDVSADSRWLATGSSDKTAWLWDLENPKASTAVLRGHDRPLRSVSISPDGHWLVTGDYVQAMSEEASMPRFDYAWRLWDLHADSDSSSALVLPFKTANAYASKIVVSADSRWLATAGHVQKNGFSEPEFLVRLWDLNAEDPAANWLTFEGADPIAITPNSRWLLTSGSSIEDRTFARLWDLTAPDSSESPIILSRHKHRIQAVLVSPDGHWLVSRDDTAAWLWDLTAANPASTAVELRGCPHSETVFENGMAFSSDGRWLAMVGAVTSPWEDSHLITLDKTAWLWDLGRKGPDSQPVALRGHEKPILALAFSPDGRWLMTGSGDETARLWDLLASKPGDTSLVLDGQQVEGRRELVSIPFAVSPNNRYFIATGPPTRIWDLTAKDPAGSVREITGRVDQHIAISPNGRWLADRERLWDLRAKHLTKPVLLRGNPSGTQLAISPDSRWLLGTNRDGPAQLWDLAADRPASVAIPFEDETAGIVSAHFSPDGTWLITASRDGAFRLWDMRLETWIEAARQLAGRELTPEERREYLLDQIPGASNATDRR